MKKYLVSTKSYKVLLNELILINVMFLFLGGIFIYLTPFLLLKILFLIPIILCLCFSIKMWNKLKKIYLAQKQYIEVGKDKITMKLYDDIQNKALTYAREEPIYHYLNLLHIVSIKTTLFTYRIKGDFEETILRRNSFTVKKTNHHFTIYRIFENDKDIKRILEDFKR